MQKKLVNSQITIYLTYQMYLRQMNSLAQNVFIFKNMPKFIDMSYVNKKLYFENSIAFFNDEIMGLLALPYINLSNLDVYGRPVNIKVIGRNGYTRNLKKGEYVIMYDNEARYPLYLDVLQYAERIANCVKTEDTNISQQKTPRIWKTTQEKVETLKSLLNNIEGNQETIVGFEEFLTEDLDAVLNPAPFVTDKIEEYKEKLWNEFLRLIGISNVSYQKKERLIKDEIVTQMGGTIAERSNRFEPRKKAVEEINEMFNTNIEVEFYDGLPTTMQEPEINETFEEEEVIENV